MASVKNVQVTFDCAEPELVARFWDQDFIDFFLLSRIGGEWQIVAKSFDHVGPTT